MFNKKLFLAAICAISILAGCVGDGARATLDGAASALENRDPAKFESYFAMDAYAANYVHSLMEDTGALNSLDALAGVLDLNKLFPLMGNVESLLGKLIDFPALIRQDFNSNVANGQLISRCQNSTSSDCPWVPGSLRDARLIDCGDGAAIACVSTPARVSSWLALRKYGDRWLIVGVAATENEARQQAASTGAQSAPPAPVKL